MGLKGAWVAREGLPELTPSDPEVLVLGRCGERRSLPGRANNKHKCSEVGTSSNVQGTEKPGWMEWETGGRGR